MSWTSSSSCRAGQADTHPAQARARCGQWLHRDGALAPGLWKTYRVVPVRTDRSVDGTEGAVCLVLPCGRQHALRLVVGGAARQAVPVVCVHEARRVLPDAAHATTGSRDTSGNNDDVPFNDLDEAFIRMHPIFIGRTTAGQQAPGKRGHVVPYTYRAVRKARILVQKMSQRRFITNIRVF